MFDITPMLGQPFRTFATVKNSHPMDVEYFENGKLKTKKFSSYLFASEWIKENRFKMGLFKEVASPSKEGEWRYKEV